MTPCATLVPLCHEPADLELYDNCLDLPPYVCPGCYSVGSQRCLPGCPEVAREREREERIEQRCYLDEDEDGADWEVWP